MEAKNHKEAQRIIKSLSKAKGGGKQKQEGVEDGPDDPVIMKSKGGDDGDSSDDEDITIHLASHNMYVSCTVISGYVMWPILSNETIPHVNQVEIGDNILE